MHLPDLLLDSMKGMDDSFTPNCRLGHKDHSFVTGKQNSTVDHGCSLLDLESMGNLYDIAWILAFKVAWCKNLIYMIELWRVSFAKF